MRLPGTSLPPHTAARPLAGCAAQAIPPAAPSRPFAHPIATACVAVLVALALALTPLGTTVGAGALTQAHAVTTDIEAEADAAQQAIEESARIYDEATAHVAELEQQIADNESSISAIEEQLPAQRERSGAALGELYKIQREGSSLVDLILSAESFQTFLTSVDFLGRVYGTHMGEVEKLLAMTSELDAQKDALATAFEQAQEEEARAAQALAEAQEARERAQREAQARAEEEARAAAEAQAKADAEKAAAEEQAAKDVASSANGSAGSASAPSAAPGPVAPPTNDNADWSSDKTSFVNSWAGRINAYLAGSPLAGQGATFAEAAWNYGVDPRFSPAISFVESSKGANCFRPYNAWGWGSVSWNSWEEAIDAHVRGLARGYGYTLSEAGAKKYCPPNWQHWYNTVAAEMNKI
ncbi:MULTISPECIES: hypothetical protein [unclassified Adlercreutzia]|uniref:coiled-coil domain-containing protein n=1 Tax=unclassified Adlercreutzia TaxID=2636013 RepID=UPI0019823B41|nr:MULTISPECIES: hypothetical protein [unclassified Adlercreutzia]